VLSYFWRWLEDRTGDWEGPPSDHEQLWAFGQAAYDQYVIWYGPPPDLFLPLRLVGSTKNDSERYKTYCHYSNRTRRYHIVIPSSEKAPYVRINSVAHEMFHRVVMRRPGVQKQCWLAETTATIATDSFMIQAGYGFHIDVLRGTAVSRATQRMPLSDVRKYKRDGRPYPRPFSLATRCLALALSYAIPENDLHRLAVASSEDEWLTSLRGDAEYIAHVLLEARLPQRAHLASGTAGHEQLARALYYKGDWDRAIREADMILRVDSRNPMPHAIKGRCYVHQHEFDGAIASLQRAADHWSRDPMLLQYLARAYLEIKDYNRAETYARLAVFARPEDPRFHLLLGNTVIKQGDRATARACWLKAVELGTKCASEPAARKQLCKHPDPANLRIRPRKRTLVGSTKALTGSVAET
jgi:tetratricopeptide (TPR) repeat protein